ncbi:hypothetical protein P7C70_g3433, partial [Phenoliferia sp. Uapishka_3]
MSTSLGLPRTGTVPSFPISSSALPSSTDPNFSPGPSLKSSSDDLTTQSEPSATSYLPFTASTSPGLPRTGTVPSFPILSSALPSSTDPNFSPESSLKSSSDELTTQSEPSSASNLPRETAQRDCPARSSSLLDSSVQSIATVVQTLASITNRHSGGDGIDEGVMVGIVTAAVIVMARSQASWRLLPEWTPEDKDELVAVCEDAAKMIPGYIPEQERVPMMDPVNQIGDEDGVTRGSESDMRVQDEAESTDTRVETSYQSNLEHSAANPLLFAQGENGAGQTPSGLASAVIGGVNQTAQDGLGLGPQIRGAIKAKGEERESPSPEHHHLTSQPSHTNLITRTHETTQTLSRPQSHTDSPDPSRERQTSPRDIHAGSQSKPSVTNGKSASSSSRLLRGQPRSDKATPAGWTSTANRAVTSSSATDARSIAMARARVFDNTQTGIRGTDLFSEEKSQQQHRQPFVPLSLRAVVRKGPQRSEDGHVALSDYNETKHYGLKRIHEDDINRTDAHLDTDSGFCPIPLKQARLASATSVGPARLNASSSSLDKPLPSRPKRKSVADSDSGSASDVSSLESTRRKTKRRIATKPPSFPLPLNGNPHRRQDIDDRPEPGGSKFQPGLGGHYGPTDGILRHSDNGKGKGRATRVSSSPGGGSVRAEVNGDHVEVEDRNDSDDDASAFEALPPGGSVDMSCYFNQDVEHPAVQRSNAVQQLRAIVPAASP